MRNLSDNRHAFIEAAGGARQAARRQRAAGVRHINQDDSSAFIDGSVPLMF